MRYPIQALTLGEILDQCVTLVRNHAKLLFGISAFLLLPYRLFTASVASLGTSVGLPGRTGLKALVAFHAQHPLLHSISNSMLIVFVLFIFPITSAAITSAVADKYLSRPSSIRLAYKKALRRLVALVWTSILAYALIILGLVCLIIPGLVLMFRYALTTQVVVLENKSGAEALRRSGKLMEGAGHVSTVFCLWFLFAIINSLLGAGVFLLPGVVFKTISVAVMQTALVVVSVTTMAVFYFSCRCRVENYDLDLLAAETEREDVSAHA